MIAPLKDWLACPRCGGGFEDASTAAICAACDVAFPRVGDILDLVDPTVRVSSEGPGDTAVMAWRRRRGDELRGPDAPENAALIESLAAVIGRGARVLDLGCGPGSLLGWLADRQPKARYLGIDLSMPALEEATRAHQGANIAFVRASSRRRLPIGDATCDVIIRRLAPALLEEVIRVLAPGGVYARFTFGANHWREIYDRAPALPRAREETLAIEADRLRELGILVDAPIVVTGSETITRPVAMLGIRSNPAAFHIHRVNLKDIADLWRDESGERRLRAPITTEYQILIARKAPATIQPEGNGSGAA